MLGRRPVSDGMHYYILLVSKVDYYVLCFCMMLPRLFLIFLDLDKIQSCLDTVLMSGEFRDWTLLPFSEVHGLA